MAQVAEDKLAECGAVFYDCEIVAMIPAPGEYREEGLIYCDGWEDYAGMGISVVGAYDFVEKSYRVFMQDNLGDLAQLIVDRSLVMGFNNHRFDDNLLLANGIKVPEKKSWDMWKAIVSTQPYNERKGFALNNMLKANGLPSKTGFGGDAPKLAQRGRWGKLISYCLGDVRLSVQLLRLMCNDVLRHPKNDTFIEIEKPWDSMHIEVGGLFL